MAKHRFTVLSDFSLFPRFHLVWVIFLPSRCSLKISSGVGHFSSLQVQFNGFVLMLRQQYMGKVTTFRQVIELHRRELSRKEEYWNQTIQVMSVLA